MNKKITKFEYRAGNLRWKYHENMKGLLLSVSLLTVASCLIASTVEALKMEDKEFVDFEGKNWTELKSKLYNIFEAPKTKEGIDRLLQTLYKELEGVKETGAPEFRNGVKSLIDICQPEGPICGPAHFKLLRTYIEKYQSSLTKVGRYLYDCEREHFKRCKPAFNTDLVSHLRAIHTYDMDNVTNLADHVNFPIKALELKASTGAEADKLKKDVLVGVLDYMEEVDGQFVRPTMFKVTPEQRAKFDQQFKRNVLDRCKRFTFTIERTLSVYDNISGVGIIEKLDKSTQHWLKALRICRYIKDLGQIGIDDFRSSFFNLS